MVTPASSPASGLSLRRKRCVTDNPLDFLDLGTSIGVWNLFDLTKAAKLLRKPPIDCSFSDEHEMRRVYSMIYDVYRCKFWLSDNAYRKRTRAAASGDGNGPMSNEGERRARPTRNYLVRVLSLLFACVIN